MSKPFTQRQKIHLNVIKIVTRGIYFIAVCTRVIESWSRYSIPPSFPMFQFSIVSSAATHIICSTEPQNVVMKFLDGNLQLV